MKVQHTRPLLQSVVLIAAVAAPLSVAAMTGPYHGVQVGASRVLDQDLKRDPQEGLRYSYDDGYVAGLTWGYAGRSGLRPELAFDFRSNDFDRATSDVGEVRAYTLMTNLWLDMKADTGLFSVVSPYLGAGIGAARVSLRDFPVDGQSQRRAMEALFAYQAGAGLNFDMGPRWTLSADYRFLSTDKRNFQADTGPLKARYRADSIMVGLRYMYGEELVASSDGVNVVAVPPRGDSDGDGVRDASDRCPDTPAGFRVNAEGCLVDQSVVLRGVNFRFNSDQLTEPAQETLRQVSAALSSQPDLNIQIIGHTDSVGSEDYNEALASLRAKSVRRYLLDKGVDADSLVVRSAGESNPVGDNSTSSGRAMNRRVEFVVTDKPENVKVLTAEPTAQSKDAAESGEPDNVQE